MLISSKFLPNDFYAFALGYRRVHGCVLHLDIKEDKIWVQHNATEMRVAHELVAMGVPKKDIVLGFQAPYAREYTGFGVA